MTAPKSKNSTKIPNQAWPVIGVVAAAIFSCITGVVSAFFAGASPALTAYLQRAAEPSQVIDIPNYGQSVPIAIDATKDWQSTGVKVELGETVIVIVVGGGWTAFRELVPMEVISGLPDRYKNGRQIWSYGNFENLGYSNLSSCSDWGLPNCPVTTVGVGTLVARIGNTEPFAIGSQKQFVATSSGYLLLRINDGEREGTYALGDNFGVLAVEVTTLK